MDIIRWGETKIRKMTFWDMGLIKFACIFFGLIIGAYASSFIRENVWLFAILFIAVYVIVVYRVVIKK